MSTEFPRLDPAVTKAIANIEDYCHDAFGHQVRSADVLRLLAKTVRVQQELIALLNSERPGQPPPCEDHAVLDLIHSVMITMRPKGYFLSGEPNCMRATRESECVEFTDDTDGLHYEIVVRRIDERSDGP